MHSKDIQQRLRSSSLNNVSKPLPNLPVDTSDEDFVLVDFPGSSASPRSSSLDAGPPAARKLIWLDENRNKTAVSPCPGPPMWIDGNGRKGTPAGQIAQVVQSKTLGDRVEPLHDSGAKPSTSQHDGPQPSRARSASTVSRTLKGSAGLPGGSAPKGTPARISDDARGTLARAKSAPRMGVDSKTGVFYVAAPVDAHHRMANMTGGSMESFQSTLGRSSVRPSLGPQLGRSTSPKDVGHFRFESSCIRR